ncbi:hypothetical protein FP744_10004670 [Trichoderma asperellum]
MEGLQERSNIYYAALDCDQLFDKCLKRIAEPRTSTLLGEFGVAISRLTRDHQARFQAWSSYLGVFAEQDVCLDRRLSRSKDVQVMVMDLLRIIAVNLRHLSGHTNNPATDLGQAQESVEGAIDRLHRLGVTIRQSSTASLISRVKAFSAKMSDASLEEMALLIVKFLYPAAPLSLQRLLGRSILERYFNLKYREEHQRRLATRRSITLDSEEEDQARSHNGGPKLSRPIARKDKVYGRDNKNDSTGQVVDSDAMLSQSGTKPSTLQGDEFQRKTEAENRRAALSASSRTSSVPIGDISYPKPPKPSGDGECSRAICPWCSESHPYGNFQDERWWRRHVDHDFRPYVCLFDTCSTSLNAFDRFGHWLKHMEERHSTAWIATINSKILWRCDIEHESPELFSDEAALKNHMREHHLESFTESQIVGITRRSSIRNPGSKDVCPLCTFDANKAPPVACQSNNSQHPSQNKRKRGSKHTIRANMNAEVKGKRRKVHFHNQAESSSHESFSSSESDLDLAGGPDIEPISPQIKARLQRKQLSRHIATHLKALSFMSLRFKAFQEQFEEGDSGSTTRDDQEDTNEGGEPSGFDTELDALSLSFSDNPGSPVNPTDDLIKDFNEYQHLLETHCSLTMYEEEEEEKEKEREKEEKVEHQSHFHYKGSKLLMPIARKDFIDDTDLNSENSEPLFQTSSTFFGSSEAPFREPNFLDLGTLNDDPHNPKGVNNIYLPHMWSVTRKDILDHQKSAMSGPASQTSSTCGVLDGTPCMAYTRSTHVASKVRPVPDSEVSPILEPRPLEIRHSFPSESGDSLQQPWNIREFHEAELGLEFPLPKRG